MLAMERSKCLRRCIATTKETKLLCFPLPFCPFPNMYILLEGVRAVLLLAFFCLR